MWLTLWEGKGCVAVVSYVTNLCVPALSGLSTLAIDLSLSLLVVFSFPKTQLSSPPRAPQTLSWRYTPGFSLFKLPTFSLLIFLTFQVHGSYFLISSTQLVFPGNIQMIECWLWLFVSPSCLSIKSSSKDHQCALILSLVILKASLMSSRCSTNWRWHITLIFSLSRLHLCLSCSTVFLFSDHCPNLLACWLSNCSEIQANLLFFISAWTPQLSSHSVFLTTSGFPSSQISMCPKLN